MIKLPFLTRIKTSWKILTSPALPAQVELAPGVKLNLTDHRIVIAGDFEIATQGTLTISAGKHLILQSARTPEERPGYLHSVWLNPDLDDQGRPVKDETPMLEDKNEE